MDTKTRDEIKARWQVQQHQVDWSDGVRDMNLILDALPESPRNVVLREKYKDEKAAGNVLGWLVSQDIESVIDDVVPVDPIVVPPADTTEQPKTEPTT